MSLDALRVLDGSAMAAAMKPGQDAAEACLKRQWVKRGGWTGCKADSSFFLVPYSPLGRQGLIAQIPQLLRCTLPQPPIQLDPNNQDVVALPRPPGQSDSHYTRKLRGAGWERPGAAVACG